MADRHDPRDDRGAVLLILSLLMSVLMIMAALVVDLGHLRAMRRANQSVADLAALAAGEALGSDLGPDARGACEAAERYLRMNESALSALDLNCTQLPQVCNPSMGPSTVTATTSSYEVTITYPVPDSDLSDSDVAGNGLRVYDGNQCERMRVAVEETASTYFAGIVGWDEMTSNASAVVRQIEAVDRRVPSLWLLDPYGCDVLTVQGGSRVTVGSTNVGGLISLDSDASQCGGNVYTIDVGGTGSRVAAIPTTTDPPGMISLFAMRPGQQTCADGNLRACDPSDVAGGTLTPQPTRRIIRSTRAPMDHLYNCRPSNGPMFGDYPDYHGIPIPACVSGRGDYIDQLRAEVGTSGVPAGFSRWTTYYSCSDPATPAAGINGNWVVDCPNFQLGNGANVVFNGGNIIFDGDIKMTGGTLAINADNPSSTLPIMCLDRITGCLDESSEDAAWVYMRDGDLVMTGGALIARRTSVYQHSGYFAISGGSPPRWSAPVQGPFLNLAVWSELSSNKFQINGGASMELTGRFFTPEANPFSLSGGSPLLPQEAQFISYRAAISGGANLTLAPLSTENLVLPPPPPLLIR